MATDVPVGRDGAYRMTIEGRYQKIAGVRRESKFFAILGGFYGFIKLALVSLPMLAYGEDTDPLHFAGTGAIILTFLLYGIASGGGRAHKEVTSLLWLYVFAAATVGSKALLEAWNNPYARAQLSLPAPLKSNSYDQALAKFLVQKLNIDPAAAVLDADVMSLILDGGGALALLASAAATVKYQQLKRQPAKVKIDKKAT